MQIADIRTSEFRTKELCHAARTLSSDEIETCLQSDDCSSAFLHEVFFWQPNIDESVRALVLNHVNCPDDPILFAQKYLPAWASESAALEQRQRSIMEGADWWPQRFARYELDSLETHLQKANDYSKDTLWDYIHQIVQALPDTLVNAVLNIGNKSDLICMSKFADERVAALMVSHPNESCRRVFAVHLDSANKHLITLARDDAALVRREIAHRDDLAQEVIDTLRDENRRQVIARFDTTTADETGATTEWLRLATERFISEDVLQRLVQHPEPVVRYAAALHDSATENIFDQLMNHANDWSCAPVAGRSTQQHHLEVLAQSDELDVLRHASVNGALEESNALQILDSTDDNQVRLGLAAYQLDSRTVIERIIETRPRKSSWEVNLQQALDPTTKAKQLDVLHRDAKELCVARAIARHQRCPKHLFKYFGWYLPEDLQHNLRVGLAVLENLPLPEQRYSERTVRDRLRQKTAQAYLSNAAATQRDMELVRRAIGCESVQSYALDYATVHADETTLGRLASERKKKLGRFAVEFLSYQSVEVRQRLSRRRNLPDSVIHRLPDDKDNTVREAATKAA